MSEHNFIRQFRQLTQKTPQEYVMHCRLDKAEELIVAHGYSPKEAAYAAGFCEPGHFYRRFRQRCGRSPHELLKQLRP
jgi:AraC family transcriptional regulator